MKKKCLLFLSAAILIGSINAPCAEDSPVSLRLVQEFIIKKKQEFDTNSSGQIFTVRQQQKSQSGIFRPPPGRDDGPKWMDVDLVYVLPGGLEARAGDYSLALDTELSDRYRPSTFSFAGRADALVYMSEFGWGTENINGNFIPYLLKRSYEKTDVPTYDFIWSREANIPQAKDTIYLNYVFKVPQQSKTMWGSELAMTKFTFAGSFSTNAPDVKAGSVFLWRRGNFEVFERDIMKSPQLNDWQLPVGIKLTSFAVSMDRKNLYVSTHEGIITAAGTDGKVRWSCSGRAPLIVHAGSLITVSEDYLSLQIIDRRTGKVTGLYSLPKYLPVNENTFAVAGCSRYTYLFFQIPSQNRILCYLINK